MTMEVESKYHVDAPEQLRQLLQRHGWDQTGVEEHHDVYYNHPCKDLAQTGEALRVRQIDGLGHLTYKGPKLPGVIKAREELEWRLGDDDSDGAKTRRLLETLEFRRVAVVRKQRWIHHHDHDDTLVVVLDLVESVGWFAEIESVVSGLKEVESARERISALAAKLSLDRPQSRSYLTMLLQHQKLRQDQNSIQHPSPGER